MVMIPVVRFDGMKPPPVSGPASELSRRLSEALEEAMGDEPVRADHALGVLAVWVAALIKVHPSCEEHLAMHFAEALAERLAGQKQ